MHHAESRPARRFHVLAHARPITPSRIPFLSPPRRRLGALGSALLVGASAPALAEMKVGVSDWPGWVAWYVAEQKGFFKKHKADVKLVWFANYTDSISALSSGQLDANSQTWSDTMGPLAKGLPLKAVLVNDNSAGNDALMVSGKIKGFADLKGKSIALEEFSISHFVLATALAKNGLSQKDVKVVNLSAATPRRPSCPAGWMPPWCGTRGWRRSRRAARARPCSPPRTCRA
jgi:NitT/TauT family transport system substrate-binding protein